VLRNSSLRKRYSVYYVAANTAIALYQIFNNGNPGRMTKRFEHGCGLVLFGGKLFCFGEGHSIYIYRKSTIINQLRTLKNHEKKQFLIQR
jgi:hypothetical protein